MAARSEPQLVEGPLAAYIPGPSEQPWDGPVPSVEPESFGFWNGLSEGRLLLCCCDDCGKRIHPPLAGCPACMGTSLSFQEVSGTGRVYSFTVVNREVVTGIKPPYVVALVELDIDPSIRMITNVVRTRASEVHVGMRVRPVFTADGSRRLLYEPEVSSGDT